MTSSNFRQGFAISPPDEKLGFRYYASVPMQMDENTLLFLPEPPMGAEIVRGPSHMLGYARKYANTQNHKAVATNNRQRAVYSTMKAHAAGTRKASAGFVRSSASSIAFGSMRHKTTVSFSKEIATKFVEELFTTIIQAKDFEGLAGRGQKVLANKAKEIEHGRKIFWAMPYIGIEDNLYRSK